MNQADAPLDVLAVVAHPDDAEISVGGTLIRCRELGLKVGVLDLTDGEPTPYGSPSIRAAETDRATAVLGLDWRDNLGLPNRSIVADLESRERLAGVLRMTRPRVLLTHYWEDAHPDHVAASQLTDAARFWAKLSKTDMPGERYWPPHQFYFLSVHLRNHVKPSFVFDVSEAFERKMEAVGCYESQLVTGRSDEFPTALDDIRAPARYWGWSIGAAYGEPFISREEVGISDFSALV